MPTRRANPWRNGDRKKIDSLPAQDILSFYGPNPGRKERFAAQPFTDGEATRLFIERETMSELQPYLRDQRKIDADQLKLLSIFHFVVAGLAIAGLGFLFLHYALMSTLFNNPEIWKNQPNAPPPKEFFALFVWLYAFFGLMLICAGIANLLSGLFIKRRRNRMFSLIVAGLNCLQVPFGTLLGVFTFIVLLRDSVREVYEARSEGLPK